MPGYETIQSLAANIEVGASLLFWDTDMLLLRLSVKRVSRVHSGNMCIDKPTWFDAAKQSAHAGL